MMTPTLFRSRPFTARARTAQTCRACGAHFTAHAGDHLAAVFCEACLTQLDEPVTAEHAWELGGGD